MKLHTEIPSGFFDCQYLGLDTETSGIDPHGDRVLLISLSNGKESIVLEPGPWLEQLWKVLPQVTVIGHEVEFDLRFLWSLGFEGRPGAVWDTLHTENVMSAGLHTPNDLASTAWRHIGVMLDKSVRNTFIGHMGGTFTEKQIYYSQQDAQVLIPIMEKQRRDCEQKGLMPTIELENQLVPVVAQMEWDGVGFDQAGWDRLVEEETARARQAEQQVQQLLALPSYQIGLFGGEIQGINLNSWQQLLPALNRIGINVENTRAATFDHWLVHHPEAEVIKQIKEYRHIVKLLGFAYGDKVHPKTGRIHCDYRQTGTTTGRLSSANPNGQNVPRDKRYRHLFIPRPDWVMITADAKQQEMRIMAEVSDDPTLREVCQTSDVHAENAKRIYRTVNFTKEQRTIAKNTGFAMIYGAKPEKVAIMTGISLEEARLVVNYVQETFPQVEEWAAGQIALADGRGYVTTMGGRRRYFPRQAERDKDDFILNQARNAPIQGTAADMMKWALVGIDRCIHSRSSRARIVLTIHDEVVVESPKSEARDVAQIVTEEMQAAGEYYVKSVPMPVDVKIAPYWEK